MTKRFLLLFLLPATVFAQQSTRNNSASATGLNIRFSSMTLDECMTVNGPGNWTIDVNDHCLKDEGKEPTTVNIAKHDYATAENVEITARNFPLLKADKMVFDNNTNQAELTGHITLSDNGVSKEIAQTAYLLSAMIPIKYSA